MGGREREEEGEGSVCSELSAGSRHRGVCSLGAQENNIESGPSPTVGVQKEGRGCDSRATGGWDVAGRPAPRPEGMQVQSGGPVSSALSCHQGKSQPLVQQPSLKSGDKNVMLSGCWDNFKVLIATGVYGGRTLSWDLSPEALLTRKWVVLSRGPVGGSSTPGLLPLPQMLAAPASRVTPGHVSGQVPTAENPFVVCCSLPTTACRQSALVSGLNCVHWDPSPGLVAWA